MVRGIEGALILELTRFFAGLYLDESDARGLPPSNYPPPSKHTGTPEASTSSERAGS